jgi:hypothetical protein
MSDSMKKLFEALLQSDEVRKVDFKRDQYRLDNEYNKSKFVKDILCMANASGSDGYIALGVKDEKGKPREVTGISDHRDSAELAEIVNGVVEAPIQFEYHAIKYEGRECAIIHVPSSIGRPHWSKRDFGILRKHVFYTRRASGNTEASIEEIRQMCLQTIRLSDGVKQKAKVSSHVIDELATLDMDERSSRMYKMLKSISPKIGLRNYRSIVYRYLSGSGMVTRGALVGSYSDKERHEFLIFMYPWSAKMQDIIICRSRIKNLLSSEPFVRLRNEEKERLKVSTLIHIAYKNIYTSALENWHFDSEVFTNEIKESWGKVMKWKEYRGRKEKHEFFMPNVSSEEELKERLTQLIEWARKNIKD